jgi:hypothetical protein
VDRISCGAIGACGKPAITILLFAIAPSSSDDYARTFPSSWSKWSGCESDENWREFWKKATI